MEIYHFYINWTIKALQKDIFPPTNLSKVSLCRLKNESSLVIQKPGKVNTLVNLGKDTYFKSVEKLLIESRKFKNIPVSLHKELDHIINSEKMNQNLPNSFQEFMSLKHQNIHFSHGYEKFSSLSFLAIEICHKKDKLVTSIYKKPTLSGIPANYVRFSPTCQKRRCLHTTA